MRSWHLNMTLLKVKQGKIETAILILRLLLRLQVFRSITFTYPHDSNALYSDAAV